MSKTHRKKYRPIQIKTNAWSIAMAGRAGIDAGDRSRRSRTVEAQVRGQPQSTDGLHQV